MRQNLQHHGMNPLWASGALLLLPLAALLANLGAGNQVQRPALAAAQTPAKALAQPSLGKLRPLACTQKQADGLAVVVKLTNSSNRTLPQGTRVYWQTQNGIADWVTVSSASGWPPQGVLTGLNRDWLKGGPCTAHYFRQF